MRSVIKQRRAVVDFLSEPSDMDVTVAKLVKRELVVDIGLDESVRVEMKAGHPHKHLEYGHVVLLNLHLQKGSKSV